MIHEITIDGYRSLRKLSVTLNPVTVLVGKSGTGKSNFVRAIRFLRNYLRTNDAWATEHPSIVARNGQQKFQLQYGVKFSIEGIPEPFVYSLTLTHGEGKSGESLALGAKTLFSHDGGQWITPPDVTPAPKVEIPMLGRLPPLSEAVIAYSALAYGIGCYEFPFGVLSGPGSNTGTSFGFDDSGKNHLETLRSIYGNLRELWLRKSILATLSTINPSVVATELDSITAPQRVFVTHQFNSSRHVFDLAQESEGFRRMLAHLLAIYQDPPKQLLVFEEPENGIYPGALALLADELKNAPLLKRGQVLLTTHSPGLLDHFPVDDLRVVSLEHGETRIGAVAPEQAEGVREGLLGTGELLTVDPARIAAPEAAGA